MISYKYLFDLTWLDAFYNASIILASAPSDINPETAAQKVFIIIYSFITVVLLLSFVTSGVDHLIDMYTEGGDC